jgi:hypothetical protein
MAKSPKTGDGAGRIKFRVIEFELDGSDHSLQESLKSLSAALGRGFAPGSAARKAVRYEVPADAAEVADGEPEEESDDEEAVDEAREAARPKKAAGPKKITPVKLLSSLKLDEVSPTLAEFAASKAPDSEGAKYLVIAYWFKYHGGIEDLTPDHFFTAYRHIGWITPKDPVAPIHYLRHRRRTQFSPGAAPGTSAINHVGERVVQQMGKAGE